MQPQQQPRLESLENPPAAVNGDMCDRCREVAWEDIRPPEGDQSVLLIEIPESPEELSRSPCRICQLFSLIKPTDQQRFSGSTTGKSAERGDSAAARCYLEGVSAKNFLSYQTRDGYRASLDDSGLRDGLVLGMVTYEQDAPRNWSYRCGAIGLSNVKKYDFGIKKVNSHKADLDFARECISICQLNHGKVCNGSRITDIGGFRVIDCSRTPPEVVPMSQTCEYLALSYVWGSQVWEQSQFAPVVMDAITATRRLGYQYLWVDRHCINQNDEEHKRSQIAQMGDIYANAVITIVASSNEDANYRLPGLGCQPRSFQQTHLVGETTLIHCYRHPAEILRESRWATRGWTLQESLLSRRRLILADDQVTFVCNSTHWPEVYETQRLDQRQPGNGRFSGFVPLHTNGFALTGLDKFVSAVVIMREYAGRALTYDSDALNACLGIIQQMGQLEEAPIFCPWGIPVFENRLMLDWFFNHSESRPCRREIFPSWSFLGWEGGGAGLGVKASKWNDKEMPIALGNRYEPFINLQVDWEDPKANEALFRMHDLRYLHITGCVVDITISLKTFKEEEKSRDTILNLSYYDKQSSLTIPRPRSGSFVKLRLSHDVDIWIAVDLEVEGCDEVPLLGLVLDESSGVCNQSREGDLSMLLMKEEDGICHRVGFLRYMIYKPRYWETPSGMMDIAFTESSGALLDELEWPVDLWEKSFWHKEAEKRSIILG